jgi:hypothetical protein
MIRMVLMFGRVIPAAILAALLQVPGPALAGNCLLKTEGFQLTSDTVHWEFVIPTGSECLQGLRGKSMLIEQVNVVEAPSSGRLAISGSGFIYKAPANESSDHFKLQILGENRRMRGTSEVVVDVSVRR